RHGTHVGERANRSPGLGVGSSHELGADEGDPVSAVDGHDSPVREDGDDRYDFSTAPCRIFTFMRLRSSHINSTFYLSGIAMRSAAPYPRRSSMTTLATSAISRRGFLTVAGGAAAVAALAACAPTA